MQRPPDGIMAITHVDFFVRSAIPIRIVAACLLAMLIGEELDHGSVIFGNVSREDANGTFTGGRRRKLLQQIAAAGGCAPFPLPRPSPTSVPAPAEARRGIYTGHARLTEILAN